jgi:hypothetical protein
MSVLEEMEGVAHAVTISSAKPIILEAAPRAGRWCRSRRLGRNAAVTTDSFKDVGSGSCTTAP